MVCRGCPIIIAQCGCDRWPYSYSVAEFTFDEINDRLEKCKEVMLKFVIQFRYSAASGEDQFQ